MQNTVHALVDESGEIVERYEYDAWGRTTVLDAAGNELSESAIGNRYCFQGREYDFATGLYYFRARWYDPVSGRWLSKDPIGISGGLNQYVFCGNNPVNYVDPSGEFAIAGAIFGGIGGFVADVALQGVANLASGETFFSDINYKSAFVSGAVGATTGAIGVGTITQGKKALSAIQTARHMQRNLHARNIAMAAGKFRNPAKTALQLHARNQALRTAGQSLALGTTGPVTKQLLKRALSDGCGKN